jgi:acyl carrier protein
VDWAGCDRPYSRQRIALPTYPFQRQRYWVELPEPQPELYGDRAATVAPAADPPVASSELLRQLQHTPVAQRRTVLVAQLQQEVAAVLGLDAALPDPTLGFFDMGMDSLLAVELKTRLEKQLEHSLSSTLAFNYPNITALADYLLQDVLALTQPLPDAMHPADNDALTRLAAHLEALSEGDMEALLLQTLATL